MNNDRDRFNRPSPPSMLSAETRRHTEEARRRIDAMRGVTPPSTPPIPPTPTASPIGKVVGDTLIQTSEEQLLEAIVECRGTSADRMETVLSYVEGLLRSGELRFQNSRTHAAKVRSR